MMRLMRKTPKQMKKRIFFEIFYEKTTQIRVDLSKRREKQKRIEKTPREAKTRRLRTKPGTRWATCCCKARTSRVCRRSPRRTRCWAPCGGTRGTKESSGAAAMRCTASARSSRRCPMCCCGTPPSWRRCAPRRRCGQTWSSTTGTRRSSASGCSRRASSGGGVGREGRSHTNQRSRKVFI